MFGAKSFRYAFNSFKQYWVNNASLEKMNANTVLVFHVSNKSVTEAQFGSNYYN